MIDLYSVIADVRLKTALLESLEWDEDLLETFLIYFDNEMKRGSNIERLVTEIKDNFNENVLDVIIELFKEEACEIDKYLNIDKGEH